MKIRELAGRDWPALRTAWVRVKRPVIVCGTDVTRETTPAFAADCVRLLRRPEKHGGFFICCRGRAPSVQPSFPDGWASVCNDLVDDIENGLVRALVVVESDPFHYYPDRARLDLAMSKLELLIAIDYFPTETVNRATIFYPSSTIFETGSTYINQEGRAQFAQRVHHGRHSDLGRRTPAACLPGICSRRGSPAGLEGALAKLRVSRWRKPAAAISPLESLSHGAHGL